MSLFQKRHARDRAARIRFAHSTRHADNLDAINAYRSLRELPALSEPVFTYDPDLESFLRSNNLTHALQVYLASQSPDFILAQSETN